MEFLWKQRFVSSAEKGNYFFNCRLMGMFDLTLLTFSSTDTSIIDCPVDRAPIHSKDIKKYLFRNCT